MNLSYYLSDIQGVSIYPIISLIIFFVFFIGLFIWVKRMKTSTVDDYKHIPLEENHPIHSTTKNQ